MLLHLLSRISLAFFLWGAEYLMATETRKVLFQSAPASGVLTSAYASGLNQVVLSSLVICNQGGTDSKVRVSIAVAAAADTGMQYIIYDDPVQPSETKAYTLGITLNSTDVIRVYSSAGVVSFNAFGVEIQ